MRSKQFPLRLPFRLVMQFFRFFSSISPTFGREIALAVAIALLGTLLSVASPYFFTLNNITTLMRASMELDVIAVGMTLVIIMGGIDVSVGGIVAVSAMVAGRAYQAGLGTFLVVPIVFLVGGALGAWNGFLCTVLRIPPIVATLGSTYLFSAIMFLVIGGQWITGLPNTLSPLVNGSVLGIPNAVFVVAAVYGLARLILQGVPFGRHLYAIGCNEPAARLSGINVDRTKFLTYLLLGLLAGFAALLYVARLRNVEINIGTSHALEAIAATVLGGASIRGGVGSLSGTLMGVFFIRMIQNGLVLIWVSSLWESVVIGGLLIFVLAIDGLRRPRQNAFAS